MTIIEGPRRRSVGFDTFRDLTDATVTSLSPLTFDADLDAETVAAIWGRMTSRDDADQAARAVLLAACDGGALNLPALLCAYLLDRPLPDPVYPEPPA